MIWLTKDFRLHDHKQIRVNLGLDSASKIFWSPDGKAFVVAKQGTSSIAVYKLGKKPDGSIGNVTQVYETDDVSLFYLMHGCKNVFKDFDCFGVQLHGENEIIGIAIASNGKFMISASRSGHLKIMDVKGNTLYEPLTDIKKLNCVRLSGCGRVVGLCGTSSQVSVWKVEYAKDGSFKSVSPDYTLGGHEEEVMSIDINTDATNIVSIDKKGTWRLFDATGELIILSSSVSLTLMDLMGRACNFRYKTNTSFFEHSRRQG